MLLDSNGVPIGSLNVGDAVTVMVPARTRKDPTGADVAVSEQVYTGEVLSTRGQGATLEAQVRYPMAGGRRPYYDVWWPISMVNNAAATA